MDIPKLDVAGVFLAAEDTSTVDGKQFVYPNDFATPGERLVHTMDFSPTGAVLAVGRIDDTIKVHDCSVMRPSATIVAKMRMSRTGVSHLKWPGLCSSLAPSSLLVSSRHSVTQKIFLSDVEHGGKLVAAYSPSLPEEVVATLEQELQAKASDAAAPTSSTLKYASRVESNGLAAKFSDLFVSPDSNLFGACVGGALNLWHPSQNTPVMKLNGRELFLGGRETKVRRLSLLDGTDTAILKSVHVGGNLVIAATKGTLFGLDLRALPVAGRPTPPDVVLWSISATRIFTKECFEAVADLDEDLSAKRKKRNKKKKASASTETDNDEDFSDDDEEAENNNESTGNGGTGVGTPLRVNPPKASCNFAHFGALSIDTASSSSIGVTTILCTHAVTSEAVVVEVGSKSAPLSSDSRSSSTLYYPPRAGDVTGLDPETDLRIHLLTKGNAKELLGAFRGLSSLTPHLHFSENSFYGGPTESAKDSALSSTLGGGAKPQQQATPGGGSTSSAAAPAPLYQVCDSIVRAPQKKGKETVRAKLHRFHLLAELKWKMCEILPQIPCRTFDKDKFSIDGWQLPRLHMCCPAQFLQGGDFILQGSYRGKLLLFDARQMKKVTAAGTNTLTSSMTTAGSNDDTAEDMFSPVDLPVSSPAEQGAAANPPTSERKFSFLHDVEVYGASEQSDLNPWNRTAPTGYSIPTIAVNPRYAMVATGDTRLVAWSTATGQQLKRQKEQEGGINL